MVKRFFLYIFGGLLLVCAFQVPAWAQQQQFASDDVFISSDVIQYDSQLSTVTAAGNVELSQKGRVLLADKITYYQLQNLVVAEGNISLMEPDGNVFFAQQLELTEDMKRGVINDFRARMTDESLVAANRAVRLNENVTELDYAVYSPCLVCDKEGNALTPTWQIKAEKVTIDTEDQSITYNNAFFEFLDIPVLYTPYMSHATPNADNKSGFLMPSYSSISTLGQVVQTPYYYTIAPNIDLTFTPIFTTEQGPVLSTELRHLTETGSYTLLGSITNPDELDADGNVVPGQRDLRGHIEGIGRFSLDNDWDWGFDIKRSSDDTYLKRYKFGDEDLLTSKAFIQKLEDNDYYNVETVSFQGLNAEDDPSTTPLILPMVTAYKEWGNDLFNQDSSYLSAEGTVLVLNRNEGVQSRRITSKVEQIIPFQSNSGHLFRFATSLRADGYHVENVPDPLDEDNSLEGFTGRVIPETMLEWKYPLINHTAAGNLLIEPIAQFLASPNGNNPIKIPNEDSLETELSDINLFSNNHYTGYDRIEGGLRSNYGLKGSLITENNNNYNFMFGQTYRVSEDSNFTPESGLDKKLSDYVGRVGFYSNDNFDIHYRFRLAQEDFRAKRNEIDTNAWFGPVSTGVNYLLLDEGNPENPEFDREEVTFSGGLKLTDSWSLSANTRRNISEGGFVNAGAGFYYNDECSSFALLLNRDFTSDRDIVASTSFTVQYVLKNLN